MNDSDTDLMNSTTVKGSIALVSVIAVEMVACLVINVFIMVFTLCHVRILKNPSIMFLTNFIIANIILAVVYMPSFILSVTMKDTINSWDYEEKLALCQFMTFVLLSYIYIATFTTTVISVDRFLFIVKPFLYKRYIKTWVAVVVLVVAWVLSWILCIPLLVGVGKFRLENSSSSPCYFICWNGNIAISATESVILLICLTVIVVTTLWTFCFARKIILTNQSRSDSTSVYKIRSGKLIGMFGMLLIAIAVCYGPFYLTIVIETSIGTENTPHEMYCLSMTFGFLNTVLNPVIQAYFRKEVNDFLKKQLQRICCVNNKSGNKNEA